MNVKAIQSIEQRPVELPGATGASMRMLVGPGDGATNFHMRQFEVAPGGFTPHHQHDYEHEILVLGGTGTACSETGERALKAGDVVWVPPNEMHQFRNTGSEPFTFICLIPAPRDCTR